MSGRIADLGRSLCSLLVFGLWSLVLPQRLTPLLFGTFGGSFGLVFFWSLGRSFVAFSLWSLVLPQRLTPLLFGTFGGSFGLVFFWVFGVLLRRFWSLVFGAAAAAYSDSIQILIMGDDSIVESSFLGRDFGYNIIFSPS